MFSAAFLKQANIFLYLDTIMYRYRSIFLWKITRHKINLTSKNDSSILNQKFKIINKWEVQQMLSKPQIGNIFTFQVRHSRLSNTVVQTVSSSWKIDKKMKYDTRNQGCGSSSEMEVSQVTKKILANIYRFCKLPSRSRRLFLGYRFSIPYGLAYRFLGGGGGGVGILVVASQADLKLKKKKNFYNFF